MGKCTQFTNFGASLDPTQLFFGLAQFINFFLALADTSEDPFSPNFILENIILNIVLLNQPNLLLGCLFINLHTKFDVLIKSLCIAKTMHF